jgi:LacI family purine nucleotide synthesis repressor
MLEEYRHIPMVVMDWGEARADFTDSVIDNAFEGGYMAGRYLIERGHREIGVIPGPLERNTGAGRLAGFMKAMEEAQITVPENWIVQGDFEPESGYRAMQQILPSSTARRRSSAAATSWRWARSAPRMNGSARAAGYFADRL